METDKRGQARHKGGQQMILQKGDIFCVSQPEQGILSKAIIKISIAKSLDNQCEYSHSGIMINETMTYEANWHYEKQNLRDAYKGCKMLIGRINEAELNYQGCKLNWSKGLRTYMHLLGKQYPWYRLPLFLMGRGLSKKTILKKPVCSEKTVGELYGATGYLAFKSNYGWVPDDVADAIKRWDIFDVIFEGTLLADEIV